MVPELDIRYLLNVNQTPYRRNIGPLHDLTASIKQHGVLKPVLIEGNDFHIIDGYRRLFAAQAARVTTIPFIKCSTWADIMTHFRPVEADCYPMDWVDIWEFQNLALKPLHQEHRHTSAVATRRAGVKYRSPSYSGYILDIAALYNILPQTMKTLRDYIPRMRKDESRFPIFVKGAFELLPVGEDARNLASCRVIKAVFDRVRAKEISEEQGLWLLEDRLKVAATSDRPRVPRVVNTRIDRSAPLTPYKVIGNMTTILDQLAIQTEGFMNFQLTLDQAQEITDTVTSAMTVFASFRRRLKASIQQEEKGK